MDPSPVTNVESIFFLCDLWFLQENNGCSCIKQLVYKTSAMEQHGFPLTLCLCLTGGGQCVGQRRGTGEWQSPPHIDQLLPQIKRIFFMALCHYFRALLFPEEVCEYF